MERKLKSTISRSNSLNIPQVKMTKTARMRLLNANPLLKYEAEKSNSELVKNLDLYSVSRIANIILEKKEPLIANKNKERNQIVNQKQHKKSEPSVISNKMNKPQVKSSQVSASRRIKQPNILRRSLSAPRIGSKMCTILESQEPFNISVPAENIPNALSKTEEISTQISSNIKTPSNKRSSSFYHSSNCRASLLCPTPSAPVDLKRRLTDWLIKKNKKPTSFKHLKCFGVHKIDVVKERNKENVNTSFLKEQGSYEDLKIDESCSESKSQEEKSLIFAPSDLKRIAKNALNDLLLLISEGYMKEQCEAWLKLIQQRCPEMVEEPQYWECKAAIEQLRGNIGLAVECYKTAVVQGAEVSSVEESLDQLLSKFKLLDIDSAHGETESNREKITNDFKNVFTSMIIKFAIQEKSLKTKSKKTEQSTSCSSSLPTVLITPVRRSTRLNRSGYTSTPGVKICSSFHDIDTNVKERMSFQPNMALNI